MNSATASRQGGATLALSNPSKTNTKSFSALNASALDFSPFFRRVMGLQVTGCRMQHEATHFPSFVCLTAMTISSWLFQDHRHEFLFKISIASPKLIERNLAIAG
jgi:hypothetical protein